MLPYRIEIVGPQGGITKISPVDIWLTMPGRVEVAGFRTQPDKAWPIFEEGGGLRYRCRVGQAYAPERFLAEKETRLENALWEALNVMQERIELSRRMAARARENGHLGVADRFDARAADSEEHCAVLRDLVYRTARGAPLEAKRTAARKRKRQG